jgi:nicotinamidase-related amidase
MRGYRVDVVKDAVIGLNKRDHRFALDQMRNVLKVNII